MYIDQVVKASRNESEDIRSIGMESCQPILGLRRKKRKKILTNNLNININTDIIVFHIITPEESILSLKEGSKKGVHLHHIDHSTSFFSLSLDIITFGGAITRRFLTLGAQYVLTPFVMFLICSK
jgi:hypothetical protein